jgi:hypothetical protein
MRVADGNGEDAVVKRYDRAARKHSNPQSS